MQSEDTSFRVLMNDLMAGHESAAVEIVNGHTAALVAVARREIGSKLARRIDPEDVVQSAYRSFFIRMGRGEYELTNGRDLWKLLVTITLNKVRRQGKYHHAQKRNVSMDQSTDGSSMMMPQANLAPSDQPGPDDAAMLVDEVTAFLATLRPQDRAIIELRLQGYTSVEIATETNRAERTVRRVLERAMSRLEEQADEQG